MMSTRIPNSDWYFVLNYESTRKFSVQHTTPYANKRRDIVTFAEDATGATDYTTYTGKPLPRFVAEAIWEAITKPSVATRGLPETCEERR
jgi:hypothetical protein